MSGSMICVRVVIIFSAHLAGEAPATGCTGPLGREIHG